MSFGELLRNWGWVYFGNLIGSLVYALLFYLAVTDFMSSDGGALGELFGMRRRKNPWLCGLGL